MVMFLTSRVEASRAQGLHIMPAWGDDRRVSRELRSWLSWCIRSQLQCFSCVSEMLRGVDPRQDSKYR